MFQALVSTGLAMAPQIAGYFGAQADRNAAAHAARQNYAQQKEFAQSGIQWKVEDAKKAGIHPLAALGASTPSTGGTYKVGGGSAGGDLARSLGDMGQTVSRAVQATATADQRTMANLQIQNARTELQGKEIDNQIKLNQLNQMNQVGPAFPSANDPHLIPGQGNALKGVRIVPSESVASQGGAPGVQAGLINSLQYTREANGNLGIAPSKDMKERIEDDFFGETGWHIKNRIMPPAPDHRIYPTGNPKKPYWFWNPLRQEFVPSANP